MREFGPCLGLDLLGNTGNDPVEQVDMLVGISVGAGEEQVGDPAKNIRLLVGRSRCESALDLGDNRPLFCHGFERPRMRSRLALAAGHYHRVRQKPRIFGNDVSAGGPDS